MRKTLTISAQVLGMGLLLVAGCDGRGSVLESTDKLEGTGGSNESQGTGGAAASSGGQQETATGGTSIGAGGDTDGGAVQPGTGGYLATGGAPAATGGTQGTGGSVQPATGGAPTEEDGGRSICDGALFTGADTLAPGTEVDRCYAFELPASTAPFIGFHPVAIDNVTTHHFSLYEVEQAPPPNDPCSTLSTGGIVATWAPGMSGFDLPEGVGLPVGTGHFVLRLHGFNATAQPRPVTGGFCATTAVTPPSVTAGLVRLGSGAAPIGHEGNSGVQSVCTSTQSSAVHFVQMSPEIGLFGLRFKTTLERTNGNSEILVDKPADTLPMSFDLSGAISPGEKLLTECTFGPDGWGDAGVPMQSFCRNTMIVYPAGSLGVGGPIANCTE